MIKHTHIAKPHEKLEIGEKWTDIVGIIKKKPRKRFYTMKRRGWLTVDTYLPGTWSGKQPGTLQIRVVREPTASKPADPTGYDERTLSPVQKDHRLRFHYGGPVHPSRKYKVQARVIGNGTYTTTGTHYIDYRQTT